jgi:hypothetical protein
VPTTSRMICGRRSARPRRSRHGHASTTEPITGRQSRVPVPSVSWADACLFGR